MAATQTKLRRGTSSQVNSMTPAEAEVVVDLSNDRLHLGDGITAGGVILPNAYDLQMNTFGFVTAGGTANAITGTLAPPIASYAQPLAIKVKITATNTNAVTINLNGLGTRAVTKISGGSIVPLIAGDLVNGGIYELVYDGTQFIVLGAMGGLVLVGQGELKTSQGTFSGTTSYLVVGGTGNYLAAGSVSVARPGGSYGFGIESAYSTVYSNTAAGWWYGSNSSSYLAYAVPWLYASNISPIGTLSFGRERYITASPPYDLGDGEVGGFIFLLVDNDGKIVSHYAADTPPWAYNGPTDIRATHKCPVTGNKFQQVMKKRTFEQIMDGAPIEYQTREVTDKIKNADMKLIPHPFGEIPEGYHVVLLDPMDDKTQRIIEYQNAGGSDWTETLTNGKITIGDECARCGPKGVHVHKMKYKFSGKF